ncbi:MAG: uncharacterized protein QOJ13_1054 [Gaiellales bacterium]|jgi:putative CocE/NonD family hydrolase|nr:uncharacterized protein [Gaiellales bacterium]
MIEEARRMPYMEGVDVLKDVRIPMPDGIELASDLYVPSGWVPGESEPLPVVMEFIPYRKDEVLKGAGFYGRFPLHGYAVCRIDVRGTGGSQGECTDEYLPQEQRDGHDAVEWLGTQPWCTRHVNMMGISYGGFTSLQVASHAPEHLTSIIPMYFTHDRYTDDCHFRGGLMRKYYDVAHYGNFMVAFNALPSYPEWSGAEWAEIWEQHIDRNQPYLLEWFRHQLDGDYWRNGSVIDIVDHIKCPVLMIGGWRDGYPNPPLHLYEALQVPKKLLMGPWNHAVPDVAVPGPRIDYVAEVVRWLDHWCKDEDTGIMDEASVAVFIQDYEHPVVDRLEAAGEWRGDTTYPAPGTTERTLYLAAGGTLADEAGGDGVDSYDYNATVGVNAGLWSGGISFGLPGDQRPDEALSLCFDTEPLNEDVTIFGRAKAVLHVASTASVMGFGVAISDVSPDGVSHLVAKGMLNATRREGFREAKPIVPGEVMELAIDVDGAGWRFPAGHRIRIALASADWPNVWPTPEPGTNDVHRGTARPSRIVLPVVPAEGSAPKPRFAPSTRVLARHLDDANPPTWEVVDDVLSGQRRYRIGIGLEGGGARSGRVNSTTVIDRQYSFEGHVDPSDPASASARGRHVSTIKRPNWTVSGTSDVMIQATATHFHLIIDLEIAVNGATHATRRWAESVPRELL